MRITERSPTGRRLQTIFIPAEPRPVMPTEVSDEIVLTHPAIPPMVGFKEGQIFFQQVTGGSGAEEVASSLVPTDRYWWVQAIDLSHTDAAARVVRLSLRDTVPNTVALKSSGATTLPVLARFTMDRPIIVPNDMQIVATVIGIVAPFVVTLRLFFYQLLHAELNPKA